MLISFPELCLDKNIEDIWETIVKFLLHPHMWLRNISSRLVAIHFASIPERDENLNEPTLFLLNPSRLFLISVSFLNQLRIVPSDYGVSNLIIKNLVSSICRLHCFAKQKSLSLCEFWCSLDPRDQGSYLEAFDLLGSRKSKSLFLVSTNDNQQGSGENLESMLVAPLLKKMGKIAMQMEDIQMNIIFNCFRAIAFELGSEGCYDYDVHLLYPLYKVCEGFAGKSISDGAKQSAEEVRDSIRDVLGVKRFVDTYNIIRKNLKERREKRRHEQKVIAVVDPVRHAKRKLRTAAKHRNHKKRKITAMKMGRWRR